jgi:hypothetical protein
VSSFWTNASFAAAILSLGVASAAPVETLLGYGPWKLGISKEEVRSIKEHGPYSDVASTGGLETAKGFFDGTPCTVSFVFGDAGLRKIQIWVYEGKSPDVAVAAWSRVYDFFRRTFGEAENLALQLPPPVLKPQFVTRLQAALTSVPQDQPIKIQMAPTPMPEGMKVFSSIIRDPRFGYYVFVYYQR